MMLTREQYLALPPLFRTIIDTDDELTSLMSSKVVPFVRTTWLIADKRRLMKAAAIALQWDAKSRG